MTTFTFTIDDTNNITAFPTPEAAQDNLAAGGTSFTSQKELAKLAADWPSGRLAEIWNSFAGVTPFGDLRRVKKFTNRATGVNRIWGVVQRLVPTAEEGAKDAPETAAATTEAEPKAHATKAARRAKAETPKSSKKVARMMKRSAAAVLAEKEARKAAGGRAGSKTVKVLDMIRRPEGATLEEIMKATDWQAHSVRGFISGNVGKKMGLTVESTKNEGGGRTYRIA